MAKRPAAAPEALDGSASPQPVGATHSNKSDAIHPPRTRSQKIRRFLLEASLVALVYFGISHLQTSGLLSRGEPAPDFRLNNLQGESVALSEFRGKKVLLHFWATWCGACKREFGMLRDFQNELPDDVVLLSIAADGAPEALQRFVAEHRINYPVLIADDSLLSRFQVGAFPTNYIVDTDGNVQGRTVGMSTRWGLDARLGCAR